VLSLKQRYLYSFSTCSPSTISEIRNEMSYTSGYDYEVDLDLVSDSGSLLDLERRIEIGANYEEDPKLAAETLVAATGTCLPDEVCLNTLIPGT
jgi:hypothetical protein